MTYMNKELFAQYLKVKLELKYLESQEQDLKQQILKEFRSNQIDKLATDFGSFTVAKRTSWIYTEAVKKIAERLKLQQIREQEQGLAQEKSQEYLLFKEKGHDE